ncbi:MAG: CAP domain-containing protein [Bacteroidota bacterium]|nr:CAP domain-containing protein [Bacteroidota bacterium]
MKKLFLLSIFVSSLNALSQPWTPKQLQAANTSATVTSLSILEKEVILYINLARMYPKEFIQNEIKGYKSESNRDKWKDSPGKATLVVHLNKMESMNALYFNDLAYENAKCLAAEQAKSGDIGHERKKCNDARFAECCSYGASSGKDIVMQWLIDANTPSLGHRLNCLNKKFKIIGVSCNTHKVYYDCCVADFK